MNDSSLHDVQHDPPRAVPGPWAGSAIDAHGTGLQRFALYTLRIAAGLLYMQHGAQKLFGLFGRDAVDALVSQMGLAGVLEFWGGLLIVLGLATRPVALLLFIEMVWAYLQVHAPRSGVPIVNGGELALLYAAVWLFLALVGGGRFSIDGWIRRRRH
jgi:putative oxidoreductase